MADLAGANQYFSQRLNSQAWDSASQIDREKALATAERQLNTLRLRPDVDTKLKDYAIYEQALFLLEMTPYDRERQRAQALGIIGGSVGDANEYSSAEIVRRKMVGITISPEALSLLGEYFLGTTRIRAGGLR